MNRPRRGSKKDTKRKSVKTSTPILGKLIGEKFPSFKRLSIIKAQCERDIREIQGLQPNKRGKKSLSISEIYKDPSDNLREARQRIIQKEESDSFTRVFYRRSSIEQPSLFHSKDASNPLSCRFSWVSSDAKQTSSTGYSKRKSIIAPGGITGSKNRKGGEKSSNSRRKGKGYALTDVSNIQEDVSDYEVRRDSEIESFGIKVKENEPNDSDVLGKGNVGFKKEDMISRTRKTTKGKMVNRGSISDDFYGKEALKVIKNASSGIGSNSKGTKDSDSLPKENGASKDRKGSLRMRTGKVARREPNCENVCRKGNACPETTRTKNGKRIQISSQSATKVNGALKKDIPKDTSNCVSGDPSGENGHKREQNKTTPTNKKGRLRKRGLKKKLWNDPVVEENLVLTFQDLNESKCISVDAEKTELVEAGSPSSDNVCSEEFRTIMEESNEFLPPPSRRDGKLKKAAGKSGEGVFKKPPPGKLLSKVLKKNALAEHLPEHSSVENENDLYPSTSTPLDSPVADSKTMPALFQGLSPVLVTPSDGFSVCEPSCVNVTYSKVNRTLKESKLDLMWNSLLNLESNREFKNVPTYPSPPETKTKECFGSDDIVLFESPPLTLPSVKGRRLENEVEENIRHAEMRNCKHRETESTTEFLDHQDELEVLCPDFAEISEWELCCEDVPYSRHDHLLR